MNGGRRTPATDQESLMSCTPYHNPHTTTQATRDLYRTVRENKSDDPEAVVAAREARRELRRRGFLAEDTFEPEGGEE
jgi:hypothetical protein